MQVVTIGGGTGQYTLLSALKDLPVNITSIVSMVDSGGSTGRLRDEYGILPPGDILKCLLALSPYTEAREILQARFTSSEKLEGHNAGNFLLTFLTQYLSNDFPGAVDALGEILKVRGTVLPVTTDQATLVAELEDGSFVYSESAIDVGRQDRKKIKKAFLVPHSGDLKVYPKVIQAIEQADFVVIGPGDLYTSIIPNLLVPKVKETLQLINKPIVFVVNIMTKFGETDGFVVDDFVQTIEKYLERSVDIVIANKTVPSDSLLEKYKEEGADVVRIINELEGRRLLQEDLLGVGDLARHDVSKLAQVFKDLFCLY
jgi:uncharacterized cofD-like protein